MGRKSAASAAVVIDVAQHRVRQRRGEVVAKRFVGARFRTEGFEGRRDNAEFDLERQRAGKEETFSSRRGCFIDELIASNELSRGRTA